MSTAAVDIRVRGVVQGVGFRPNVFRLAHTHALTGWVHNGASGVEIHLEGAERSLRAFLRDLRDHPPPAADIASVDVAPAKLHGFSDFTIRASAGIHPPTTRVSPDLAACDACVRELFDPADQRAGYAYVNCTECGPRIRSCSIEAEMVERALDTWPLGDLDLLFIENVGNLVCPASYDLGEALRLVLLSVTEGEDKPLKYPTIFNTADVAVITKRDIAAAAGCDLGLLRDNILRVRPGMTIFEVSSRTGVGMEDWWRFVSAAAARHREPARA